MKNIAVFPGSFDPITKGHEDIIRRALPLFDRIVVAIGINSQKKTMFSIEQRKEWIARTFDSSEKVAIADYTGLTVNFCQEIGARAIIRGLRNALDFQYEQSIAQMNKELAPDIETIFMATEPAYSAFSSTIVRDILRNGGKVDHFIPNSIRIDAAD